MELESLPELQPTPPSGPLPASHSRSISTTPRLPETPPRGFHVSSQITPQPPAALSKGPPRPHPPVKKDWGKGGGTYELVRVLMEENASDLRRVFRKYDIQREGRLPVETVLRGIINILSLNPQRDGPYIHDLVQKAATPDGYVTLAGLMKEVSAPISEVDTMRYCAVGIMDPTIQRATTGSVRTPIGYDYNGPPFAVTSDAKQMTSIIQSFQTQRMQQLQDKLKTFSKDGEWLTHHEFLKAVSLMDKFQVPEYEIIAMIDILDPGRKRGKVSITRFFQLFGSEYMKSKSSRTTIGGNTNGSSNSLQWPSSLNDTYDRKQVMEELRHKKTPKLKVMRVNRKALRSRAAATKSTEAS